MGRPAARPRRRRIYRSAGRLRGAVVVRDEMLAASGAHELRNEYCLQIVGEVALRPEGNANPDLPTGEIEVVTTRLECGPPTRCRSRSTTG